ncbi:uncharacterized protein TrAFT101_008993 [Trichoderma asperellum]|uniref:uncharacterized protein n=1 Tax=Trichoderma asperellum TaxID=101201 RepID=UPI00332FC1B8|nr:hypothetical protein TrAFT101_008993 [Trichoderma asperellum]
MAADVTRSWEWVSQLIDANSRYDLVLIVIVAVGLDGAGTKRRESLAIKSADQESFCLAIETFKNLLILTKAISSRIL